MSKEEVIEKIKKLLRMKRGGTAAEVETALNLARDLAAKHGIDIAGVNPDEQSEERRISHIEEVLNSKLPIEAKYAAAILVNFFNVQIVLRRGFYLRNIFTSLYSLVIIGTSVDCEIARYVFVFLQHHFRNAWKGRENKRLKNRAAFLYGMFNGLAAKLEEERDKNLPDEAGLMVIGRALKQREEYLKQHFSNAKDQDLKHDDSDAWRAKLAGIHAGKKTEIRKGLNGDDAPAQLVSGALQLAQ